MITNESIREINTRMAVSIERYGPLGDYHRAIGALVIELHEVVEAMHQRDMAATRRELYDVANVAIRFAQELCSDECATNDRPVRNR